MVVVPNIWWIPAKPTKRVSTEIQMIVLFLLLGIPPTMYTSRESWDIGDYKNQKIFGFFMPFCNQNDLNAKIWILAKNDPIWKFYGKNRKTSNYRAINFSGKAQGVLITFLILFGRYSAEKLISGKFCWCMVGKKNSKNRSPPPAPFVIFA